MICKLNKIFKEPVVDVFNYIQIETMRKINVECTLRVFIENLTKNQEFI